MLKSSDRRVAVNVLGIKTRYFRCCRFGFWLFSFFCFPKAERFRVGKEATENGVWKIGESSNDGKFERARSRGSISCRVVQTDASLDTKTVNMSKFNVAKGRIKNSRRLGKLKRERLTFPGRCCLVSGMETSVRMGKGPGPVSSSILGSQRARTADREMHVL